MTGGQCVYVHTHTDVTNTLIHWDFFYFSVAATDRGSHGSWHFFRFPDSICRPCMDKRITLCVLLALYVNDNLSDLFPVLLQTTTTGQRKEKKKVRRMAWVSSAAARGSCSFFARLAFSEKPVTLLMINAAVSRLRSRLQNPGSPAQLASPSSTPPRPRRLATSACPSVRQINGFYFRPWPTSQRVGHSGRLGCRSERSSLAVTGGDAHASWRLRPAWQHGGREIMAMAAFGAGCRRLGQWDSNGLRWGRYWAQRWWLSARRQTGMRTGAS